MPLLATEGGGGQRQLAPPGTHVARCYQLIDLGTQSGEYAGKPNKKHKVRLSWELPDELAVFDDKKGEEPFAVHKTYTLSLNEKSVLRHDLESWRGKAFTADELKGFDIAKLLGVACLLTIVHETKGDKTYANVNGVAKLAKGMQCGEPVNKPVKYEVEDGRNDTFKALPEFLQTMIANCEEWKREEPEAADEHPGEEGEPF